MNESSLYNALKNYVKLGRSSFHTPGHKGFLRRIDSRFDLTELTETDSLYHASGIIRAAEDRAANLFGAKRTIFSAGGCTLAIQTMLLAVVKETAKGVGNPHVGNGVIRSSEEWITPLPTDCREQQGNNSNCTHTLFARDGLHQSAVNAMPLFDIRPTFIKSHPPTLFTDVKNQDDQSNLASQIESAIIDAKKNDITFSAVYLTSPNYFGQLADVAGAAEICKKYDIPLLVDNAHGSHLIAFPGLHPLAQGASMTACSAHKTLPVLTGGAFLNCNDGRFAGRIKRDMPVFGSTSPSYLIMSSLDSAVDLMIKSGIKSYQKLAKKVSDLKETAKEKGIEIPGEPCDPCRLTLITRTIGMTGTDAAEYLRSKKIEPEYADESAVVLIITPWNSRRDLRRLKRAITRMPVSAPLYPIKNQDFAPKAVLTPRQAMFSPSTRILVSESIGKIAAEAVCPCPPGTPVIIPGEIIEKCAKDLLIRYGIHEIDVVR